MCHDHDQPFITFATSVRSNAKTCNLKTVSEYECVKQNVTRYTEKSICWCISHHERSPSTDDILSRTSYKIIYLIESKKMRCHATENHGLYQQYQDDDCDSLQLDVYKLSFYATKKYHV